MLKLADIVCPTNISGYKYVVRCGGYSGWQASRNGGGRPDGWRGPMRATPAEAAQDYCDYANGNNIAVIPKVASAGHLGKRKDPLPNDPEVEHALGVLRDARAQREGKKGYVYCIAEQQRTLGVKVGYSVNPQARVAELQTGNPRPLALIGCFEGTEADERELHARFINDNLIGEWFTPSDDLLAEFDIDPEELA
jgi:hypothetical protein